jgi:hypothetical protein
MSLVDQSPHRRTLGWILIFTIAVAMTLLNAIKPLHMDDTVYYSYATQIAAQPGDPYGGEITDYWMPPKASMDVLVPAFLPYWWSLAYRVHGDQVFLCKLWLFPFHLMLVWGTWGLARRFARGLEPAIALMVAASPAILPGLNFMLDIPALALGVASIHVFIKGSDRRSMGLVIAAGLIAGLSINVKWTGFVFPGVMAVYALTHRRIGLGIVAGLTAALVFVGWEYAVKLNYGQSHFLLHTDRKKTGLLDRINAGKALVAILGGVAPGVLMLGLIALRRPVFVRVVVGLVVAGLVAIAAGFQTQPFFLTMGVLLLINLGTVATVLLARRGRPRWRGDADDWFLVLWLGLEFVGFFVLSPYSAVRRVVGIVVAATLLAGRLASRTCRPSERRRAVDWIAAAGLALGLFYYGVDLHEARVEKAAAEAAAHDALARLEPGQTAWYAGRWGFRHYAAKAGLTHIAVGRTELKRGDLLVVHENKIDMEPKVTIDPALVEEIEAVRLEDTLPFRTVPPYYSGKEPLQRQVGPRFVVHIYRVINPFTPLGWIPPEFGPKDRPVGAIIQRKAGH